MKKVLLFLSAFIFVALAGKVNAQCTVDAPTLSNMSTTTGPDGCTITFDITFNFTGNNGNKWKSVYIWTEADYNNLPANLYGANGLKVPTSSALDASNALAVIAMNSDVSATLSLANYPGNTTLPANFQQVQYSSSGNTLTLKGVVVHVPTCGAQVNLVADVGASNANSFNQFSCLAHGSSFVANDPIVNAFFLNCGAQSKVGVGVTTTAASSIVLRVFKDSPVFSTFEPTDTLPSNLVSNGSTIVTTTWNGSQYVWNGDLIYNVQPGERFDVWVVAYASGVDNPVVAFVSNSCATLPVNFSSFNASRKNSQSVALTWETSFEQNNRGFYVQRNTNGEWKNVAFVFTSADGGNSSQTLRYAYNDPNNLNSISYYRIQQVDIDGRARLSEVRTVRGEEQASKIMLFPNPGTGGKVNVLFNDEAAAKDVLVYDATGRVVKSFKSISGNSLSINGLKPGMYSVQVTNVASASTSSEKFIIQN